MGKNKKLAGVKVCPIRTHFYIWEQTRAILQLGSMHWLLAHKMLCENGGIGSLLSLKLSTQGGVFCFGCHSKTTLFLICITHYDDDRNKSHIWC